MDALFVLLFVLSMLAGLGWAALTWGVDTRDLEPRR
jgi:hypothetical protein